MTQAGNGNGNGNGNHEHESEVTYTPVYSPTDPNQQVGWWKTGADGEEEFIFELELPSDSDEESEEDSSDN